MLRIFFSLLFLCLIVESNSQNYTPDWESLDSREIPGWFSDARFGIFVHWGIYSVPSYRPFPLDEDGYPVRKENYAEWYVPDVLYKPERNNNFHKRAYGENFSYFDFLPMFRAELFDPKQWAELFYNSGAQYVVLTAKHSDGFTLWPSNEKNSAGWNAGAGGPKKDLVGELTSAVRSEGMRMGLYYSFLEYWTTKTSGWPSEPSERTGYYVPKEVWDRFHIPDNEYKDRIHFHVKELINTYKPDILWTDGEWDYNETDLDSRQLLSWIYNESPNKESIVVNDRWAKGTRGKHGGFYTSEYGSDSEIISADHPWEECRGMGFSFGYNRAEGLKEYKSADDLIEMLAKTTARGGNFLLNVGPSADGRIPLIMQERLMKIGRWMKINGEAIYGTKPLVTDTPDWVMNPKAGDDLLITTSGDFIYIFLSNWNYDAVGLKEFSLGKYSRAVHLGSKNEVFIKFKKNSVILELPPDRNERVSVIKIQNIQEKPEK